MFGVGRGMFLIPVAKSLGGDGEGAGSAGSQSEGRRHREQGSPKIACEGNLGLFQSSVAQQYKERRLCDEALSSNYISAVPFSPTTFLTIPHLRLPPLHHTFFRNGCPHAQAARPTHRRDKTR